MVSRIGPAVTQYRVGEAVVGFGPASFGDRVLTRAAAISRIPANFSFEAAATIPSTFFTVYYALHHLAHLQEGEKILIHGAAGGVGIAAIQLAQWLGADIYATAGSEEKRDFLRMMGVAHVYDSRSLAYADEILAETGGQGVDVVLNSLAGEAINRNLQVLRPFWPLPGTGQARLLRKHPHRSAPVPQQHQLFRYRRRSADERTPRPDAAPVRRDDAIVRRRRTAPPALHRV
ncbi:polyketide synthase [Bordetella holmesii]|nr:polyketide synthase [Bordetella holmesii]